MVWNTLSQILKNGEYTFKCCGNHHQVSLFLEFFPFHGLYYNYCNIVLVYLFNFLIDQLPSEGTTWCAEEMNSFEQKLEFYFKEKAECSGYSEVRLYFDLGQFFA